MAKRSKRVHGIVPKPSTRIASPSSLVATVPEVSAILGVSEATVIRMIRRGDLRRLKGVRRLPRPTRGSGPCVRAPRERVLSTKEQRIAAAKKAARARWVPDFYLRLARWRRIILG